MSVTGIRLGVVGYPLAFTLSPELHRAGLASAGLAGESAALPTSPESLDDRLRDLADAGYRGVNVTAPFKERVTRCLARTSAAATRARSVNTVGFDPDGWWGDTTDGPGFLEWLATVGSRPDAERVLLLGAGGAARSVGIGLIGAGARVVVSARRPEAVALGWPEDARPRFVAWRSAAERQALEDATLVIHATPLDGEQALPVAELPAGVRVVDLRYGPEPTSWVRAARARGLEAFDGLGLLVHQARASLSLWLGHEIPVEPLARAVGWPR